MFQMGTHSIWIVQLKVHQPPTLGIFIRAWSPFSEPVGSSVPKFSSVLKSSTFDVKSGKASNLNCPAQGSPSPTHRYTGCPRSLYHFHIATLYINQQDILNTLYCGIKNLLFSEPVGSSIPKFSSIVESSTISVKSGQPFNLNCPAQGSPAPSHR